jgi:predicted RNA-binding Zn-ribbon protein involved in translation (DUF1610 family)
METVEFNRNLPAEEKLRRRKAAKGGTWYDDNYTPYCMCCKEMPRMLNRDYGFECPNCGNMIGHNMERLAESPLNDEFYRNVIAHKLLPEKK